MTILKSIVVNAAVAASASTNVTLYTAPATGYAIINVSPQGAAATASILVGGKQVCNFDASALQRTAVQIFVGPSQAVSMQSHSAGTVDISGVEFINST